MEAKRDLLELVKDPEVSSSFARSARYSRTVGMVARSTHFTSYDL